MNRTEVFVKNLKVVDYKMQHYHRQEIGAQYWT